MRARINPFSGEEILLTGIPGSYGNLRKAVDRSVARGKKIDKFYLGSFFNRFNAPMTQNLVDRYTGASAQFTRNSEATYIGSDGTICKAAADVSRHEDPSLAELSKRINYCSNSHGSLYTGNLWDNWATYFGTLSVTSASDLFNSTDCPGAQWQRIQHTFTGSEADYSYLFRFTTTNNSVAQNDVVTISFYIKGTTTMTAGRELKIVGWGRTNAGVPTEVLFTNTTTLTNLSAATPTLVTITTTVTNASTAKMILDIGTIVVSEKPAAGDTCDVSITGVMIEKASSRGEFIPTYGYERAVLATPTTGNKALLLEPEGTNLCTESYGINTTGGLFDDWTSILGTVSVVSASDLFNLEDYPGAQWQRIQHTFTGSETDYLAGMFHYTGDDTFAQNDNFVVSFYLKGTSSLTAGTSLKIVIQGRDNSYAWKEEVLLDTTTLTNISITEPQLVTLSGTFTHAETQKLFLRLVTVYHSDKPASGDDCDLYISAVNILNASTNSSFIPTAGAAATRDSEAGAAKWHLSNNLGSNLCLNGDMEVDANWSGNSTPSVNELSTKQVHSGSYSRKFTIDSEYDGIQSDIFNCTSGKYYRATFWLYGDGTSELFARIRNSTGSGTGYFYFDGMGAGDSYTPSAAWTRHTFDFLCDSTGEHKIQFIGDVGITSGTHYIDDVTIQEIGATNTGTVKELLAAEGTMLVKWKPGYAATDFSGNNYSGIVASNGGVSSLFYNEAGTNSRIKSYDGSFAINKSLAYAADTWYNCIVQWGYDNGGTKYRVGYYTGGSFDWLEIVFDGAYSLSTFLQLGQNLIGPMHMKNLKLFNRKLSDIEIKKEFL